MPAATGNDGVAIDAGGRRVMLKWHKLRRFAKEPPFMAANLPRGLAIGASMEIDARVLADGNWVCLHDDVLDRETTGTGPVEKADTETIRGLRLAGADFAPPLLADLAGNVAAAGDTGAVFQIDLKEPAVGLTPAAVARFAEIIAPVAGRCLLSGTEWAAVRILGDAVPDLPLGFDPLDIAEGRRLADRADMVALTEETAATAPPAVMFYLHYKFVLAALALGHNPIARLQQGGGRVDVWTLDPTTPDIGGVLARVVNAGADQITTNDPLAMAALWAEIRSNSDA